MTVAILKLSTGQEIISEVEVSAGPEGQQIITLIRPCEITRQVGEEGQLTAAFTPLAVYYKNAAVVISNDHVVYTGQPEEGFEAAYTQQFRPASGLIVPEEKKLVVPQ
jgi:hypothetical protein